MSPEMTRMVVRAAGPGIIRWIGVRPERHAPVEAVETVQIAEHGLIGDRRTRPGKRAVSLIQWEHLPVIAALAGHEAVAPEILRRNIAVSGLNLLMLRKARFRLGTAMLQGTGLCAPCSRMEEALGHGGFNAVRGHGGITAEVISPGNAALGDRVALDPAPDDKHED
ncbi:MAG: MOSC domain-containing protein [Pseudomonadota bacterium]